MAQIVKLASLRDLVDSGSVRVAEVIGQKGGWALLVKLGMVERVLAAKDGKPRVFGTLEAAARLLRELKLTDFTVHQAGYQVDADRRTRPDRARAMTSVHAAAEHDSWFQEQVRNSMKKLDQGEAVFSPLSDVASRLEKRIKAAVEAAR